MTQKLLLSGGSGFVGSNFLRYVLDHTDWSVTCLVSFKHKGNCLRLNGMALSPRVNVVSHDLKGPLPNDLGRHDYIVHMASISHVDASLAEPIRVIENNVSITLQLFEFARRFPPRVCLLFSTDEVWGDHFSSEWELTPSNPYSASKSCQEVIGCAYHRSFNLPLVVTSANNIVGPMQDPEKFVPKIAFLIKNNKTVILHTDAYGLPASRWWTPIGNISSALLFILQREPAQYNPTTCLRPDRYSLGGSFHYSVKEILNLVSELMGKGEYTNVKLVPGESIRPGFDCDYSCASNGKLAQLGWKPSYNLLSALDWVKTI